MYILLAGGSQSESISFALLFLYHFVSCSQSSKSEILCTATIKGLKWNEIECTFEGNVNVRVK